MLLPEVGTNAVFYLATRAKFDGAVEDPVLIPGLWATVLHQLDLEQGALNDRLDGRDCTLPDEGGVVN
ncbi:MAG: hypothetical protein GY768_16865 [Planctomycetaceae bacterium]|nr:hypothetical protein [Planctomycetaceae bacterium]